MKARSSARGQVAGFSKFCLYFLTALGLLSLPLLHAREAAPFNLLQTIPMPGVKGRLDHLDVDGAGRRLFVSGLEYGSVEVVDLKAGRWSRRITGLQQPQGILYARSLNKLFVASGQDGTLRVFRGDTLAPLATIPLEPGPNRLAFDSLKKLLYVGYGGKDAGKPYGEVGGIDARAEKLLAQIQVAQHPAELLLDPSCRTLFAFIFLTSQVQVIDTAAQRVISTWKVSSNGPGDAAYDDFTHRLFIGTHTPPQMVAMNSFTGAEIAHLPTVQGMDGVFFDAARKRIYISGGRGLPNGSISAYRVIDADHYEPLAPTPTRPGAGTSFWSPQLDRYFVAAPASGNLPAAILVFQPRSHT